MFGELEDSDIYVNNQNESFEEPADSGAYQQRGTTGSVGKKDSENGKLMIYVVVLVLVMVAAGGFYFYKMKSDEAANTIVSAEEQQSTQEMGDYFYDKATAENPQAATGAAADTAVVNVDLNAPALTDKANSVQTDKDPSAANSDLKATAKNKDAKNADNKVPELDPKEKSKLGTTGNKPVVIPVLNGGRVNPFLPYQQEVVVANMPQFDIIAPPMELPEIDPLSDAMMSTKVSGIMFDSVRPSAIINFDGTDHLVHKGDRVKGYTILDITKDRVVMKNGTNIYRASVGQEIDDNLKFNEVSNLNSQFGGAYGRTSGVIEIKGK